MGQYVYSVCRFGRQCKHRFWCGHKHQKRRPRVADPGISYPCYDYETPPVRHQFGKLGQAISNWIDQELDQSGRGDALIWACDQENDRFLTSRHKNTLSPLKKGLCPPFFWLEKKHKYFIYRITKRLDILPFHFLGSVQNNMVVQI